ncbi:DUF1559 domain-containing protein [bacterium]|nr:DUF1559 domain-containing protein [bacterium]
MRIQPDNRHRRLYRGPAPATGSTTGFSLVELLVVLAIVGILASLLLPAIAKAQAKGRGAACLNHLRQLAMAMQLYADDFRGALPYNYGYADTARTIYYDSYRNWANNVLSWELDEGNTNRQWLAQGGLGPYVNGATEVFRCPSDRVVSQIQKNAGWTSRIRSYSLNAMVGNAGEFSRDGFNLNNPGYVQFFKESDFRVPSRIFTFIEEHPDSINDGYFLNKLAQHEWFDLPASWHNNAANLTFADGHAETHRWVSPITSPAAKPNEARLPIELPAVGDVDFDWLMARTTVAR